MAPVIREIKSRFGNAVYTTDEKTSLEMAVAALLKEKQLTMAAAESCTGGMVAARMVNVSGVSDVFMQGMVTYSNEAKMRLLGVREKPLLLTVRSVRKRPYRWQRAERRQPGRMCVSITGIAGPEGGTPEKPVGLVYMACCVKGKTVVKRYQFKGNRAKIREQSTVKALDLVRLCVLEYENRSDS